MALAVDSRMPSATGFGNNMSGGATLSVSFTNAAGTLLVCGIGIGNTSVSDVTGVTYNTVAMLSAGAHVIFNTDNVVAVYYLLSPSTGAQTLAITMSGTRGGSTGLTAGCISYTGNDTTTPIKQYVSASGTSALATVDAPSTTSGNLLFDASAAGSNMTTPDSGTLSWANNFSTASGGGCGRASEYAGTGGTVTCSHTISASDSWGIAVVEIAAASGGATRGLFQSPALSGLGIGGSFFRDPLQGQPYARSRSSIYVPARMAA